MAYTEADEVEMMSSPSKWPRWPFLPVKNPKTGKLGLIAEFGMDGAEPVVYDVDLYTLGKNPNKPLAEYEMTRYLDFEGVVDAGWVVD